MSGGPEAAGAGDQVRDLLEEDVKGIRQTTQERDQALTAVQRSTVHFERAGARQRDPETIDPSPLTSKSNEDQQRSHERMSVRLNASSFTPSVFNRTQSTEMKLKRRLPASENSPHIPPKKCRRLTRTVTRILKRGGF